VTGLADRHVVVLGGSSGIGLAVAAAAAAEGAQVTVAARNPVRLAAAAAAIGHGCRGEAVDAADPVALRGFFARVGPVDHLAVTLHDISGWSGAVRPLGEMDLDAARAMLLGKFWAQFQVLALSIPALAERATVTLSSGAASRRYVPNHALLGPNNLAVEGLVRYASRELGPRRVNAVCAGLTETPAHDGVPDAARAAMFAAHAKGLPVRFVAKPDDIAPAYLFLMKSAFASGTVLDVDGGASFGFSEAAARS
jgi:NAD(P)-dependent dehydrogenase (short-subunit alcohol dehydrogenase family)